MVDRDILFIFGAPRSGTTYVTIVVREHFDYGLCAEGKWVLREGMRLKRYGNLGVDANLQTLITQIRQYSMFEHFRTVYSEQLGRPLDVTPMDIVRHMPEETYAGVVYGVFASVAEQMQKHRIGNKYPDYWKNLPLLSEWFPRAKFLYVVRDGRDVALSVIKQPWGAKTVYGCARRWVRIQESAFRFFETISPERYSVLYYEELLKAPGSAVDQLTEFLGVPTDDARRSATVTDLKQRAKLGNYDKWRKSMSMRDIRAYESVAADWLWKHGYELFRDPSHVLVAERIWYRLRELEGKIVVGLTRGIRLRHP